MNKTLQNLINKFQDIRLGIIIDLIIAFFFFFFMKTSVNHLFSSNSIDVYIHFFILTFQSASRGDVFDAVFVRRCRETLDFESLTFWH